MKRKTMKTQRFARAGVLMLALLCYALLGTADSFAKSCSAAGLASYETTQADEIECKWVNDVDSEGRVILDSNGNPKKVLKCKAWFQSGIGPAAGAGTSGGTKCDCWPDENPCHCPDPPGDIPPSRLFNVSLWDDGTGLQIILSFDLLNAEAGAGGDLLEKMNEVLEQASLMLHSEQVKMNGPFLNLEEHVEVKRASLIESNR